MFQSARLKLTGWYVLIIMLVCLFFSGIVFRMLNIEVGRLERTQRIRAEQKFEQLQQHLPALAPGSPPLRIKVHMGNPELIQETTHRILMLLVGINSGIFVFAGGLSYFLAGRTLQPIKEMMDEQNRFISDASHELKTPLTSLKSAFEVFLREKNPKILETRTLMEESILEVNKLQSLSESLLQLAQYEIPNGHTKFEKVSLNKIVSEAVNKIGFRAKQKHIVIVEDLESVDLTANKYGLVDLLVILLDNAIKYSPKKSQIKITSRVLSNFVQITVNDEGPGIPKKDLSHIFDRFYRSDTARSKSTADGYGLGLAIAKKIVDIHNGTIRAESAKGKGTMVLVHLPLQEK